MGLDVTGQYRYPVPNPAWLKQSHEDVLDAALPIVDSHHHLWVESDVSYLLDEIAADVSDGHAIAATVFVQAHYGYRDTGPKDLASVGETEKVVEIARAAHRRGLKTRIAAGIVGYVDLTGGDVNKVLDAHEVAGAGSFCGVRHSVSRDSLFPNGIVLRPAPENLLADRRYRAGLSAVAARGLVYDAMLYHRQIPELVAVAQAFPELTIVLDHLGCILGVGPYAGREKENFDVWHAGMLALSRCPNVFVKIGGFGMIVCGARWHERPAPPTSTELAEAWRPYIEACIALFGARRCMFESNFPVDKAMYSYRTLWNAFKRVVSGASADEKAALFSTTAATVYSLDLAVTAPFRETADA